MIKERYVSSEVARLLRDKGFNEVCHATYDTAVTGGKPDFCEYEVLSFFPRGMKNTDDKYNMVISAPSQAVACDWIEETFNISIELWTGLFGYEMSVRYAKKNFTLTGEIINKEDMPTGDNSDGSWSNKEQAYNDMIKYVLTNLV